MIFKQATSSLKTLAQDFKVIAVTSRDKAEKQYPQTDEESV